MVAWRVTTLCAGSILGMPVDVIRGLNCADKLQILL